MIATTASAGRRGLGAPVGGRAPMLDEVAVAGRELARRRGQRKGRMAGDLLRREAIQPAADHRVAPVGDVAGRDAPEQVAGHLDLARRDGVVDRPLDLPATGVP